MIRKATLSYVIMMLVFVLTLSSCSDSEDVEIEITDIANPESMNSLEMVPYNTERFGYLDLDALRKEPDLMAMYDSWEKRLNDGVGESLGIDLREISYVFSSDSVVMLRGEFETGELKAIVEAIALESLDYHDVKMWRVEVLGADSWITLEDDVIIIGPYEGNIRDSILVLVDEAMSLYDKEEARGVMEKLPRGIIYTVEKQRLNHQGYSGLLASGLSIGIGEDDSIEYTWSCMFNTENNAVSMIDYIKRDVKGEEKENWRDVSVTQDGRFVMVETKQSVRDFLGG